MRGRKCDFPFSWLFDDRPESKKFFCRFSDSDSNRSLYLILTMPIVENLNRRTAIGHVHIIVMLAVNSKSLA
jgi:hypothetical protein